jgi:archaellum component FlaC
MDSLENAAKEQSPIESALGQLDNNIDVLSKSLDKLANLIKPVLKEPEPQTEGKDACVDQASCLGQRIQTAARDVNGITNYVQDLQSRVQL